MPTAERSAATPPVLVAESVGKEYRIYRNPRDRLLTLLTGRPRHHSHWALRRVSFTVLRGQCVGLIGDNGAGKSTLLKMIAGTLHATEGRLEIHGRVTAILELGAGFHPDFSGRENLRFGGALIGLGADQIASLEDSIIDFSGLREAIDRPIKSYSSGMVVRLAFALVTAKMPDILVVDEALAVGDQNFQLKCIERILAFRKAGCTIFFCSHSLYHIRQLCDAAVWVDQGSLRAWGPVAQVLPAYEEHVRVRAGGAGNDGATAPAAAASSAPAPTAALEAGVAGKIESLTVLDLDSDDPPALRSADLTIVVEAISTATPHPHIGLMIEQSHGVGITSTSTYVDEVTPREIDPGRWRSTLVFPDLPLHAGEYVISAYLFDASGLVVLDQWYQHLRFRSCRPNKAPGLVHLPHFWSTT